MSCALDALERAGPLAASPRRVAASAGTSRAAQYEFCGDKGGLRPRHRLISANFDTMCETSFRNEGRPLRARSGPTAARLADVRAVIAVVAGVVAAVVVLWVVLLIGLAVLHPEGSTLRDAARLVPDTIRLTHRLAREDSLRRGVRVRLWLLLAYLAFPIDLVPDLIPVLGYADDAIVIGLVLRSVVRHAGPELVRRLWPGSDEGLAVLSRLCRLPGLRPDR